MSVIRTEHRADQRGHSTQGRFYYWKGEEGRISVTNANQGFPMPQWTAKKLVREYLYPNWDDAAILKGKMDPEEFQKFLQNKPLQMRDNAGAFGTTVHDIAEAYVLGSPLEDLITDDLSDEAKATVFQFIDALETLHPSIYAAEAVIYNRKYDFAGTLDAIWDLNLPEQAIAGRFVVDYKTSKSGVWSSAAAQCAALARGEFIAVGDEEVPMPDIDGAYVLWLRPEKWELIPVDISDETFTAWLAAKHIKLWKDGPEKEVVGRAVAKGRAE